MKKLLSPTVPKIVIIFTCFILILALTRHFYPNAISALSFLEYKIFDFKFQARGSQKPDPRIVILALDDESLSYYGGWKRSRDYIAKALEKLQSSGPLAVGIDVVFSDREENPTIDLKLIRSIEKLKNVVLGYFFYNRKVHDESATLSSPIQHVIQTQWATLNTIPHAQSIETNFGPIGKSTPHGGFFDVEKDEDGSVRRVHLVSKYQNQVYPFFALKLASVVLGKNIGVHVGPLGVSSVTVGDQRIRTDHQGRLTINYRGGANFYPRISVRDLLEGKTASDSLKDKIILVGVTAKALFDERPTPFSKSVAGVEIHANILDNILNNNYFQKKESFIFYQFLIILFVALFLGWVLTYSRLRLGSIVTLLFTFGVYFLDRIFFFGKGLWIETGLVYIQIYLIFINALLYRYFAQEKLARQIRKAFEHYLAPQLVEELVRDPSKLKLSGEKKVLTVLFADIRDFTRLSEKLESSLLTKMVNEYLTRMTDVVFKYQGMIDKYMGDALMAIFGAPVPFEDHADKAVETGLNMLKALNQLNHEWKQRRLPSLHIGIGIHTGNVLVGNMGSSAVFDYTVVGDSVNLTSRLEKATKHFKKSLLISEHTKMKLPADKYIVRRLDKVIFRGVTHAVAVYEVLGLKEEVLSHHRDFVEHYEKALDHFQHRQFEEALIYAKRAEDKKPGDYPTEVLMKKCEDYLLHPPTGVWNPITQIA
ncbi:MAG: adenylate/guanylate cyclase domain-containing protein [Deltaproteobacteria bacterium]|nr:adenylate/guanylate cyclase domain-containing protein [Deltaproteobacteria bacterium]